MSLEDLRETFDVSEWRSATGWATHAGGLCAGNVGASAPRRAVEWQNYRFEVIIMDGRRIDQVLVTRRPTS